MFAREICICLLNPQREACCQVGVTEMPADLDGQADVGPSGTEPTVKQTELFDLRLYLQYLDLEVYTGLVKERIPLSWKRFSFLQPQMTLFELCSIL